MPVKIQRVRSVYVRVGRIVVFEILELNKSMDVPLTFNCRGEIDAFTPERISAADLLTHMKYSE